MNIKNYVLKNRNLFILFTVLVFVILAIGRPYNLFVNDDGIFIRNIKNFYDGNFSLHPLTAPTFYLQAVIGYITTKIFGFSFENLRILNIFFAFLTAILTFLLIHKLTKKSNLALIITLCFIANPFYWFLSYSYMTEIHFFLFATLSFIFFYNYLYKNTIQNAIFLSIALGSIFLIRQIGLIFAISFLFSILLTKKKLSKNDLIIILFPAIAFFWYQSFSKTTEYSEAGIIETLKNFLDFNFMINIFLKRLYDSSIYYGLFILPMIPLFIFNKEFYIKLKNYKNLVFIYPSYAGLQRKRLSNQLRGSYTRANLFASGILLLSLPFIFKTVEKILNNFTFPTLQNVFTLKGFYTSAIPASDRFVNYPLFYNLHTYLLILGLIGFVFFIFMLFSSSQQYTKMNQIQKTIYIASLLNFFVITSLTLAFRAVYDRYIYLTFFLALIPIAYSIDFKINKSAKITSAILLGFLLVISIIFEKDYISWNHKRNQIIEYTTKTYNQGICDLEGTGEWEDYLYYECKDIQTSLKKTYRISWQDTDIVEQNKYIKLETFNFKSYLGKQENKLYLLKKINDENQ